MVKRAQTSSWFRWVTSFLLICLAGDIVFADPTSTPEATPAPKATPAPYVLLVEGQVFNHSGGGIAEATVILTLKKDRSVIAETKTTEYGDIQLKAEKRLTGDATVTISKTHYVTANIDVTLSHDGELPFVDHRLEGAIVLEGTVQDKAIEQPIAGAEVVAKSGYKDYTTETDGKGAFKLEGILPGGLSLKVTSKGYADHDVRIREAENAGLQTIPLSPERIVNLTIVDDSKSPVSRVVVEVIDSPHQKYRQTTTDSDGKAKLEGLDFDCESLKVRLTHATKVSDPDFERMIELPADVKSSDHELIMAAAGIVTGTITSKSPENGSRDAVPSNGARISIGTTAQEAGPKAWSDFDGLYEIQGVPGGQAIVTAHLAGHGPELRTVTVEPNKKTTVDFQLKPGRSITGVVKNAEGNGQPGTYINATGWRGHATLGLAAMTDANGAFEIMDAPLDEFTISVYANSFEPLLDQMISAEKSAYEFELKVDPRSASLEMAASIKSGEPAPDFSVKNLDGKSLTLTNLKGKIVVLDFWATWCGPCIGEIPGMIELSKTYADKNDVVIISVSLDADEAKLRSFVKERKMKWHHVFGQSGNANQTADAYGVVAIPSMFVIDRQGKIALSNGSTATVKNAVAKLLESDG